MKVNWYVAAVLGVCVTGMVVLVAMGRMTEASILGVVGPIVTALLPALMAKVQP